MRRTSVLLTLTCLFLTLGACARDQIDYKIHTEYSVEDPQFRRTIGNLMGPPLLEGNAATTLLNGDEIFPEMLGAIHAASRTIDFETFVYWSGNVGQAFADALAERAAAGVKVHVLIDAVGGGSMKREYIQEMKDAGAQVELYHALHWFDIRSARKLDNRTHRKLLIIDGRLGFTGGVGIADEWGGHAQDKDHWRDTHYKVEGPVVAQLQSAFMDEWMEATGEVLHSEDYFPPLQPAGGKIMQVFKSDSRGGSESMHLMYLLSFAAARKSIDIETPYFVPDRLTAHTLVEARRRGVPVRIIVPGPYIDEQIVQKASQAKWGGLLRAGVEIWEYQPTMFHCKLMIVDDLWTAIGSSNLDPRSFSLNSEANLNVLDRGFALEQQKVFEDDLTHCRRVTLESWRHRPFWERFWEFLSSPFEPEL